MFKTRRLIVETVVFLLLATLLIAFYGGEDEARADSLPEPGKIDEKIDNGLNLALEAIRIAGNHKGVEGVETNSFLGNEVNQMDGFPEKKVKINIKERAAGKPYKKTSEMHNPLITEPIKIQKKKHSKKIQNLTSKHYTIKVPANKPWTRTGVSLKQDDIVRIYCKGKVMPGGFEMVYKNTSCLAEGYHFTRGNFTVLPDERYMAAIGKIGNMDTFYIGSGREFVSYVDGPLYLGINDLNKSVYTGEPIKKRSVYWKDNTGYFDANIYVYRK